MKNLLLILPLTFLLSGCYEIENGEKVGSIVKFSKAGFFIKTYDGELIRGNLNSGTGSFGRPFEFAVENSNVIKIIEEEMKKGKEVKIKYHQEFFTFLRNNDGDNYFVDDVEILN